MKSPVMHATPKTHTWIIVLLVWVIALLIFLAGYMIYDNQTSNTANVVTETSCSEEIADAIKAYEDGKGDDNDAETSACPTTDFYATGIGPNFSYPITWEVFSESAANRTATIIHLSEEPLWLCDGCDGPGNAINIHVLSNTAKQSLDTYTSSHYTTGNGFVSTTKGTMNINGTTVLRVKGQFDGMGSGPFEDIVYVTDANIIVASNMNFESDPEVDAAWEVIKNSLNFSEIE